MYLLFALWRHVFLIGEITGSTHQVILRSIWVMVKIMVRQVVNMVKTRESLQKMI